MPVIIKIYESLSIHAKLVLRQRLDLLFPKADIEIHDDMSYPNELFRRDNYNLIMLGIHEGKFKRDNSVQQLYDELNALEIAFKKLRKKPVT